MSTSLPHNYMFLNFCWISTFLIFYSSISCELYLRPCPMRRTIFWKSMMRSFRWIWMNCFNRLRFLTEVSTNLQKMHFFWQFKDHISERKKGKRANDTVFSSTFRANCISYSFLYLKNINILFYRVLSLVHSGL